MATAVGRGQATSLGLLRIDISGAWLLAEFGSLLLAVDTAYDGIRTLLAIADYPDHSTSSVTLNDVAREAGVSRGTARRVFTSDAAVSYESREAVERAARRLGYVHSRTPQKLGQEGVTDLLEEALDDAREISQHVPRAMLLLRVAVALGDDQRRRELLDEALNAIASVPHATRVGLLIQIASAMNDDIRRHELLEEALAGTRRISDPNVRGELLVRLAASLDDATTNPVQARKRAHDEGRGLFPDLQLRSVQHASPGFIELVGALHPLKILSDFITRYRQENTARRRQELAFQLELLDRMTPSLRDEYAPALLKSVTSLAAQIDDPRVGELTVIEVAE